MNKRKRSNFADTIDKGEMCVCVRERERECVPMCLRERDSVSKKERCFV